MKKEILKKKMSISDQKLTLSNHYGRSFEEDYLIYLRQKKFKKTIYSLYTQKYPKEGKFQYYQILNMLGAIYIDEINNLDYSQSLQALKEKIFESFPNFIFNISNLLKVEGNIETISLKDKIVLVNSFPKKKIVILRWNEFEVEFSEKTYNKLFSKIRDDFENPDFEILRMALRYQNIGSDSLFFFSLVPRFWPFLDNWVRENTKYEPIECFSSPLNNNFPVFYSLFLDTDEKFGSLGDFLTPKDRLPSSGFYIINPPYTDNILDAAAEKVLLSLEKVPNFSAILSWPHWLLENKVKRRDGRNCVTHDNLYLRKIVNLSSNLLRWKRVLQAGKHRVIDISKGNTYPAKVEEILLFVSNDPEVNLQLSEVEKYLEDE